MLTRSHFIIQIDRTEFEVCVFFGIILCLESVKHIHFELRVQTTSNQQSKNELNSDYSDDDHTFNWSKTKTTSIFQHENRTNVMSWDEMRTNIQTLRLSERRLEINLWFGVPMAHNMLKRGIGPTFRESRFFAQTTTHQSPNLCASKFEYIPLNDTQKGSRLTHPWKIGSTFIVPMARCVRLNEMKRFNDF